VNQQFEIRFRHFKRGRRSERTIKINADTRAQAEGKFLAGIHGTQVHIISTNLVKEA